MLYAWLVFNLQWLHVGHRACSQQMSMCSCSSPKHPRSARCFEQDSSGWAAYASWGSIVYDCILRTTPKFFVNTLLCYAAQIHTFRSCLHQRSMNQTNCWQQKHCCQHQLNHMTYKEMLHVADSNVHLVWDVIQGLSLRLVSASERNLRRALLSLEACKVQQYPFIESQDVVAPDWEMYIQVKITLHQAVLEFSVKGQAVSFKKQHIKYNGHSWSPQMDVLPWIGCSSYFVDLHISCLIALLVLVTKQQRVQMMLSGSSWGHCPRTVTQAAVCGARQTVRAASKLHTTRGEEASSQLSFLFGWAQAAITNFLKYSSFPQCTFDATFQSII